MSKEITPDFARIPGGLPFGKSGEPESVRLSYVTANRLCELAAKEYRGKTVLIRETVEEAIHGEWAIVTRASINDEIECKPFPSLDHCVSTLAAIRGISVEEFTRQVLAEKVFGRYRMAMSGTLSDGSDDVLPEKVA